jgi:hypothetical protein
MKLNLFVKQAVNNAKTNKLMEIQSINKVKDENKTQGVYLCYSNGP